MTEEFSELPTEDRIRAENEFLQLKLMAEYGMLPGTGNEDSDTPPEVVNQFLKRVLEFEQHYATVELLPLGQVHLIRSKFPMPDQVPPDKVEEEWRKLLEFLRERNINVDAVSPRVTVQELYRFVMEELVNENVPETPLKGSTINFIYDEFHPDKEYEACHRAQDDCILPLFGVRELFFGFFDRRDEGVWLNNRKYGNGEAFVDKIREFQSRYDQMILQESVIKTCEIGRENCIVKGTYSVLLEEAGECRIHRGEWLVTLYSDIEYSGWSVSGVGIDLKI